MLRVVLFFLLVYVEVAVEGTSPLCLLCPCNSRPPQPPKVNCDRVQIDIFNNSYWLNEAGHSYNITSLSYRNVKLNLTTPFPHSPLKLLDLSNNSLKVIGREVFRNLDSIQVLILAWNELEELHPDVFKGNYEKDEYYPLRWLWKLDLSYNKIHSIGNDLFQHLELLSVLKLDHNPLKVVDAAMVQAISSVIGLESLDLSYTQLSDLPEDFLFVPTYLLELKLSGNNFTEIPRALTNSRSLQALHLDNNPLNNLSGKNIFPLVRDLVTLHMSKMPFLEVIGAEAMGNLLNLKEVHISHCPRLKHVDQAAFFKGKYQIKPRKVYMSDNKLECWKSNTIDLKSLTEVNFSGNPWKCECTSLLAIQMPVLDVNGIPKAVKGLPLHVHCGNIEMKKVRLISIIMVLLVGEAVLLVLGYIAYAKYCRKKKTRLTFTHPKYILLKA